jgi:ankyrin repeat protein
LGVVSLCLEHGADLSAECGQAHPALVLASQHARVAVVRLLLRAGADADGVDGSGQTALHAAAQVLKKKDYTRDSG